MPVINRYKIFLASISGLLLTLAFPKSGLFGLAWCALLPLLLALRNITPSKGFYLGFCAGLVHYLTLVYWLADTMQTYGHLSFYLSLATLMLLSAYLALYPAVFSMAIVMLSATPWFFLLTVPCLWVALEFIRTFLFTGFPWELLGYSQFKVLPLIQISDILGVYGVSFCIALGNAASSLLILSLLKKDWQTNMVTRRQAGGSMVVFAIIFGLAWFYGTWRIPTIDYMSANSPHTKITIVQGNIDQAVKWDPAFQQASTSKYVKLSLKAKPQQPDLVVWPETATPFYFLSNTQLSQLVLNGIREAGTDFLVGSPSFHSGQHGPKYYNSAYLVSPTGDIYGRYEKAHLVPFGEYVPLKQWLPFIKKVTVGVGDFSPGQQGQTIPWGQHRLGIQICYEIIFPSLARAMTRNKADLLVNITNDAWYGRSSAPYQHFSMTLFRAVENRRALIRAANTGISGFIDPAGRIIASTPIFENALLTRTVPLLQTTTYYSEYGDLFAVCCLALMLIVAIYVFIRNYIAIRSPKRLI